MALHEVLCDKVPVYSGVKMELTLLVMSRVHNSCYVSNTFIMHVMGHITLSELSAGSVCTIYFRKDNNIIMISSMKGSGKQNTAPYTS